VSTHVRIAAAALAAVLASSAGARPASPGAPAVGRGFIQRVGRELRMNGAGFRVAGASNYYLMYKSRFMVDDVLQTAKDAGFNVIRTWGALDIGDADGAGSIRGKADGVYFHYWDGAAPAFNDGEDGLQHLDYVVWKAGQLGLRLDIGFVNNWNDFGGMDQYVAWRGGQYHDEFYTDPVIRGWFKDWIAHLLNRVNPLTGLAYKDDPTILVWELANEPRCQAYGRYPTSGTCTTETLLAWADEMSRFVKSIDRKHLVSAGDEGFFCIPGATSAMDDCSSGVDTVALADLPAMDVMSFHLYPDAWGQTDPAFGTRWIERHIQAGRQIRERVMLGEFGILDKARRNTIYKEWTDTVLLNGGGGALYWMLAGKQDDGTPYPDYDGFTVYCPSPVCTTFSNFADMVLLRGPFTFPPVADDDQATTEVDAPVTLAPVANDVTYWFSSLAPGTLDLDPATAGVQRQWTTEAGTFAAQADDTVVFTPAAGWYGKAHGAYVVSDSWGRASNVAALTVTVKPPQDAPLFSFEDGTEGWAAASWQATAGAVATSTAWATHGNRSLEIAAADGGWFGLTFTPAAQLTGKTHLLVDVQTIDAGTSQAVALQLGDAWTWCQSGWTWQNAGTTATLDVELTALDCGITDLSNVKTLFVFFSGGGTFRVDAVRVQ